MKKILLIVIVFLIGSAAFAQSSPIRVRVLAGGDNTVSREVADNLAGKIGSTSRYALVTTDDFAISVTVGCLTVQTNGYTIGVACTTDITYWPVQGVALSWNPGSYLALGPKPEVADLVFNDFVRETSDENLKKNRDSFKMGLNLAIWTFPKGLQ
jgi:hypothetical protein